MKNIRIVAGIVLGLGAWSSAALADGSLSGRLGLFGGQYSVTANCPTCGTPLDDSMAIYGALLGGRVSVSRLFFDLGVEALKYSDTPQLLDGKYRTDINPSLGVYLGDNWNIFVGYRDSLQGDSLFSGKSDTGNGSTQSGPFGGVGVRFSAGRSLSIVPSLAYNSLKLKFEGSTTTLQDFTLNGFSFRLGVGINDTPHSFFLKWQRFDGNYAPSDFSYTENFVTIGYQASFAKAW